MTYDYSEAVEPLLEGGVGVIPTDTLYGLVCSAFDADAVSRIFELKQRDHRKPLIVLVADIDELERFGVEMSDRLRAQLAAHWPGPVSIVLPTMDDQFEYLSRGTDTIAFRIPAVPELRELLRTVGPLVAPSANTEGLPPSRTVVDARRYFGTEVDFYVDGGVRDAQPSTVIELDEDGDHVIRP